MDSIDFDTFKAPEGGVELSDTLSDWREKTNGIIEKLDAVDTDVAAVAAGTSLATGAVALENIESVQPKTLLGNIVGTDPDSVSEVDIDISDDGLQDSDTTIPTSKAVKDHVDDTLYRAGMVVEMYGGRCVGQTVSAISGNVTMPNIGVTIPTNSGKVIGAVRITRPANVKYIVYDFDYQAGWNNHAQASTADGVGIWSTLGYVDKRTSAYKVEGGNFDSEHADANSATNDTYTYPLGLLEIEDSLNHYVSVNTDDQGHYKNRFFIECVDSAAAESAAENKIYWPVDATYTIFTRFRNEHGTDNEVGLFSNRWYRSNGSRNGGGSKLASPTLIITTTA